MSGQLFCEAAGNSSKRTSERARARLRQTMIVPVTEWGNNLSCFCPFSQNDLNRKIKENAKEKKNEGNKRQRRRINNNKKLLFNERLNEHISVDNMEATPKNAFHCKQQTTANSSSSSNQCVCVWMLHVCVCFVYVWMGTDGMTTCHRFSATLYSRPISKSDCSASAANICYTLCIISLIWL